MATIGALNRRLDKVEATAATIGNLNGKAFDLYAACFLAKLRTEEGDYALREIVPNFLPDAVESPISDASQKMMQSARNEARAAIKAAGERDINADLLEQAFIHLGNESWRPAKLSAEDEAQRDRKRPSTIAAWFPCVCLRLWARTSMGRELWDDFLSGNHDDGQNAQTSTFLR